jgi:uncharacterized alpha-E superfamily protein
MDNKEYLQDVLVRGAAFESLIRNEGWKYIKIYIENATKTFATRMINEDMDEKVMLVEKGKIKGYLSLLAEIENSLLTLKNARTKPAEQIEEITE